jgi:hypothetical protein
MPLQEVYAQLHIYAEKYKRVQLCYNYIRMRLESNTVAFTLQNCRIRT